MTRPGDEQPDPAQGIMVILLLWSILLALHIAGRITALLADKGCM